MSNPDKIKIKWNFLLDQCQTEILLYPFHLYFEDIFQNISRTLLTIPHNINEENIRLIIIKGTKHRLINIVMRPLIWEFALINKKQKKKITFLHFINVLASPRQLKVLFKKYPVMEDLLINVKKNYLSFQLDVFDRLSKDLKQIKNVFCQSDITLVNWYELGDAHCNGRKTLLLSFKTGNGEKGELFNLIYKPRQVKLDCKFQKFLNFVNDFFNQDLFKLVKIIDKNNYGWIEFIKHEAIKKGLETQFYYRLGILLGIVYSLNGHDSHFENLIAHGNQPVLIDLECLLSIPVNEEQCNDNYWPNVYETAIIPSIKESDQMHYDFSALLYHDNQMSPNKIFELKWVDEYTIRVQRKRLKIMPIKNNPYYKDGSKINLSPLFYKPNITKGFEDYYLLVLRNKKRFTSFVKENFSDYTKRVIFRATFIYDKLMSESYHPKLLSNKHKYIAFLSQINNKFQSKIYQDIFHSEQQDFIQGDIPCFFYESASHNIINSKGEHICYPYEQSSIGRVIDKIKLFNEKDLHKQRSYIFRSLEENYVL